jgi:glycosyltransferase involved in cell wall biosynthesis
VYQLGANYRGDPHDWPWPIYPADRGGDPHGAGRLQELIERLRPALVLLVNDLWVIGRYSKILSAYRDRLGIVAYCPVDGDPVEPGLLAPLSVVHRLVTYTEYARLAMEEGLAHLRAADAALSFPPIEVLPHGVDTGAFFPWPDRDFERNAATARRAAKEALFPGQPVAESFLVLNANRNQPRKRIDITMKGFARFAAGKPPGVKLYLHMGIKDLGWDVPALARLLGIDDRLIVSTDQGKMPFFSDEQLNLIYNACDVGVNTASGEGWGLVGFEHAATGAPQIVPRHSACAELWEGAAPMLEPMASLTNTSYLTEERIVSPEALAVALERLYRDRATYLRYARSAQALATRPEYRWSAIAERWHTLFQDVLKTHRAAPPRPALTAPRREGIVAA